MVDAGKMTSDLDLCDLVERSYDEPEEFGLFRVRCETDPITGAHLIGFGGTVDVVDWMANLDVRMTDFGYIRRMHLGFARLWVDAQSSILAMIRRERAKLPGGDWYIAGHSLGGVLATLTAKALGQIHPYDPVELVTFGMPRFTDRAGTSRLPRARHYRLDYDPVPKLPSWRPWRRYSDPVGVVNLPRPNPHVARMIDWRNIPIIRRHDLRRYRDELAHDAA